MAYIPTLSAEVEPQVIVNYLFQQSLDGNFRQRSPCGPVLTAFKADATFATLSAVTRKVFSAICLAESRACKFYLRCVSLYV